MPTQGGSSFFLESSSVGFRPRRDEKVYGEMVGASLEYVVSMARANTHYFDVTLRINLPEPSVGPMNLRMPVWTPGHYSIEDFPKNVVDINAKKKGPDEAWEAAHVEKQTKNTWRIDWRGRADTVRADYAVHAFEYHDTKSYLDALHAIVNGASVFIYPVGMENKPVSVELVPYPRWNQVSTGLEQLSKWKYLAGNIDELIDSPIEVGNQEIHSFFTQNVEHQVSLFGDAPLDRDRLVRDIEKVVVSEVSIFGQIPYKKYVFIVNFTDGVGGGLEHLNSTVCFVPRLRLIPREEYNFMLGLFSHEFFHTWNVKRLRPRGLGPFNYSAETYTKSLWIAEGITSYYDDYVLRRAGIYSVSQYLEAFAVNINQMKLYPGSRWQSAEESSFDTWIKHRRGDPNAPNVTMSYYTQGAIIGWMLDLQIRKNTQGQRTLDNVMRRIYEETYAKDGRPYSEDEFEAIALDLGGERLKDIFDSRVKGREDVDFDKYLGYVGLRLEPVTDPGSAKGFLGIRLSKVEEGKVMVSTRLDGSPAERMGLSVNDEIIGIDGLRLGHEKFPFYISNTLPGTRTKVLIARNGILTEVAGEVGTKPFLEHKIAPLKEATDEQKFLFKNWLLEEWKAEIKYPEYVKSPDRKPMLDFI